MRVLRAGLLLASVCGVVWSIGACDSDRRPNRARAAPRAVHAAALGPIETLDRLREYRAQRDYKAIRPFLLDDQADIVLAQIRAVDRLVDATALLRRRIEARMGLAAAQEFAYGQVANVLGVFSRDVTLLDANIEGDRARVSFQIGHRVPLDAIEMVRRGDRWRVVADPIEGVPEQVRALAAVIEQAADGVQRETCTVETLRRRIDERQAPILRRLSALVDGRGRPSPAATVPGGG